MSVPQAPLHLHDCCDFTLASELALPHGLEGTSAASVWIRLREVDPDLGPDALHGFMAQARPDHFLFQVAGVARFLIRDGREILIHPAPGADPDSLRAFLLTTALAALLLQRGFLVLAGGAATRDDRTVALLGAVGAGRSTMLAALQRQGWSLLSDEICAVKADARGRLAAWPVYPGLALWRDCLDRNGQPRADLSPLRPGLGKYMLPFEQAADSPRPLTHVVELRQSKAPYSNAAITGVERLLPLLEHASLLHFLGAMAVRDLHLELAAGLTRQAVFHRVNRPRSSIDEAACLAHIMTGLKP